MHPIVCICTLIQAETELCINLLALEILRIMVQKSLDLLLSIPQHALLLSENNSSKNSKRPN